MYSSFWIFSPCDQIFVIKEMMVCAALRSECCGPQDICWPRLTTVWWKKLQNDTFRMLNLFLNAFISRMEVQWRRGACQWLQCSGLLLHCLGRLPHLHWSPLNHWAAWDGVCSRFVCARMWVCRLLLEAWRTERVCRLRGLWSFPAYKL